MNKTNTHKQSILLLCHRMPYPPNKGDKIRTFNIINYLKANEWNIHLGSLYDCPEDLDYFEKLESYCTSLSIAPHSKLSKILCPLAIVKGTSLSVEYFRNKQLQRYVDTVLASENIAAALIVSAPMAEYLRATRSPLPPRRVLDLVDVDSEKWRAYAECAAWPISQLYRLESRLHGSYEKSISDLFDNVILATDAEASLFRSLYGKFDKVIGVSNGVDLQYFSDSSCASFSDRTKIVFCGAMDYQPNVDSVVWFADAVLPIVRRKMPETVFWIVGANPTSRVRALAERPGVRVTGTVKDVRSHVAPAMLSVAPIRIARGVQNKVLEAMAMSKAVLATPQAFEGIDAVAGQDLAVAVADPETFARATLDLLQNPDAAAAMGAKARACMEQHYSWATRLAPLESLLR